MRTLALLLVVLLGAGCGKREKLGPAPAPSFSELLPMPEPSISAAPTLAEARPAPSITPSPPSPVQEIPDLPEDAGEARCPSKDGAAPKLASVFVELLTSPKPTAELVIPSLGVRKRLWMVTANPHENPNSCRAWREPDGGRLRVECSEVMTSATAKIYARGSDVVLSRKGWFGAGNDYVNRYELPCGTSPRFEPVACPGNCRAPGAWEAHCSCSEHDPRFRPAPAPASTSQAR